MSNLCTMLRDLIEDEKKASKEYSKLRAKMIGHPNHKAIIDETITNEAKHYKNMKIIAKKHGCRL